MRFFLGVLVVLFNLADNATTFMCLRAPVSGYDVVEANPIARWLFDSLGLVEGLLFEMILSTAAIAFIVFTQRIPHRVRLGLLTVLITLPAWASLNNYLVMRALGLPLDLL